MADTPPDFTPVTLITGFLGSGKTTLLQRLLLDPTLSDTAVLINEFGEIGLDHHLLGRIDETMVVLQSGCVCCTLRGELSTASPWDSIGRKTSCCPSCCVRLIRNGTKRRPRFPRYRCPVR